MEAHELTTQVIAGVHEVPQTRSLENPNLPLNDPSVWETVFGEDFTTWSGEKLTHQKAFTVPAVWQAVTLISGDIAKLPLEVYRRRPDLGDGAREQYREHPLYKLISFAPNREQTDVQFWRLVMCHALIWGNAYIYIDRDMAGNPIELLPLLPDRTTMKRMGGQLYFATETSASQMPVMLAAEDVLHIDGLGYSGMGGCDLVYMARQSWSLALAQSKFASKFFRFGGRQGGILELPATMPKPTKDMLEEGFRKTYEGTDNPFKTVILRDNAKFHNAQTSPHDSQMVEASESQVRDVARWFNLSPSKLGLSDSVSYNSKAEDNQNYLDSTLSIWLELIAAQCNRKLLAASEQSTLFIEHNTAALLKMDILSTAQAMQIQIASKIINPNEARARLNMLPYDGGEEYANPNTTPGAAASDPEDTPADDTGDSETEDNRAAIATLAVKARDKAKRYKALIDWVDSGFFRDRVAWRKERGQQPPTIFDSINAGLAAVLETAKEPELWLKVDDFFKKLEQ